MTLNIFSGRFRPKPLPGTALYSATTNKSGPILKYDDQSGNLFAEETFTTPSAALSIFDKPTFSERRALFLKYRRTNPEKQEGALFNLCRMSLLQHVESLTPDVLIDLPWHYGKIIWDDIIHATADSYTIFRNFCEVYGHEPDFHPGNRELCNTSTKIPASRHLRIAMSESTPWIPHYIPYLASPSAAWLVNLTIKGGFDFWELTELNGLRNLVCLTLEFPPANSGYNALGRVFKNWVTNKANFNNLRVLRLMNILDTVVSGEAKILANLNGLSGLKVVELRIVDRYIRVPIYRCEYLKKKDFGIGQKTGWAAFCGDTACPECLAALRQNADLANVALSKVPWAGSDAFKRMHKVAEWIIMKERMAEGKRRVMLDVSPSLNVEKVSGWVYFYREETGPRPIEAVSEPSGGKKRPLSEINTQGEEKLSAPPKRQSLNKTYKGKASKRRDIGSLLSSFN
ncbi:hypothetical protein TWF102_005326 [Orbilia oligospora]|uniref:Uncharacterized protein n=1 Tax=Orbilia oligospora TaxID=2813651 RepID=A0A7C8N8L0_ORBOL|nr:hypothetical protein TWF102_005326 [Orbilia oligospora]KAF3114092.1 hypothetical protein TWF103_001526 [Orbilia oligospora]